jgi:transposase
LPVKPILAGVAERVRVRRLSDEEGQRLLRIVRRGEPKAAKSVIRYRRAMVVLASASGNSVPAIARLVAADEDTVREVIHRFNELGMRALDPRWAGGRPRRISAEDEEFLIETARTRPEKLGCPFTHWSVRKLIGYLAENPRRIVRIGRERARRLLAAHEITFQRTKTWKESPDPEREAKLARIEQVINECPDRAFAFDEFGPLACVPTPGTCWAPTGRPQRLPANYHKTAGVRQFHGCYSVGEDRLWGVVRARKSAANTLAALRSIRAARPDGEAIYVILDNLSAHKGARIRRWAARHHVELCFTPTYASWANPIEAHFGPLRSFVLANSAYRTHVALTRALQAHLRWRNVHARHPDVLAAQRRERARVRSERHRRWGQPTHTAAA